MPVIQPREPVERILEATQGTQQRLQAADRPDIPAIAPPPDDFADEPVEDEPVDTSMNVIPDNWRKQVVIGAREIGLSDDQRHDIVHYVTKGRTRSSKELLEGELPAIWDRLTSSASSQALKLMNEIWSDPATAYKALHKVEGLEQDVKTWQFNEWRLVVTHCAERITHSQEQDAKLS